MGGPTWVSDWVRELERAPHEHPIDRDPRITPTAAVPAQEPLRGPCAEPERRGNRSTPDKTRPYTRSYIRLAGGRAMMGMPLCLRCIRSSRNMSCRGLRLMCKEVIFKPIIEAMYDKSSSPAKLTKEELSEAVDVMLSRIADLTGVYVDGLEGEL